MCLNPRRILNRSRIYDPNTGGRLYVEVPCGQCSECLKEKINEYMLRSYAQWEWCKAHGGFAFMECLTYRDECLL